MHSLARLHHSESSGGALSYEMLFRTAKALSVPAAQMEQMFRIMLFNLLYANLDDHAQNVSFLMNSRGEWSFAPAYDLTFDVGDSVRWHQMSINAKTTAITKRDVITVAKQFGIANYEAIIKEMLDVRSTMLPKLLKEYEIGRWLEAQINNNSEEIIVSLGGAL